MTESSPSPDSLEFAQLPPKPWFGWKLVFRLIRWSTYGLALITLFLVFHKAKPPDVETSAQAAARAEEKFLAVEQAVSAGRAATLQLDQAELNSYLATRLEEQNPSGPVGSSAGSSLPLEPPGPSAGQIEQVRSNVREVKVELVEDRVKAFVVFALYGKEMTLELEGRISAENGYLRFSPTSGRMGSFPISRSAMESAVRHLMDSPENREKLRLPPEIADLRIENGQLLATYQ